MLMRLWNNRKLSLILGRNSKWYPHFRRQFGNFFLSSQHFCIETLPSPIMIVLGGGGFGRQLRLDEFMWMESSLIGLVYL